MKRASQNADTTVAPGKCIKLNCEELKSADAATLIGKILSTTNKLNEANEMVRKVESTCRRFSSRTLAKEEELKDLVNIQWPLSTKSTPLNPMTWEAQDQRSELAKHCQNKLGLCSYKIARVSLSGQKDERKTAFQRLAPDD
ncbi:hypothetical protein KIN20_026392 [Parelaphostrongylus tenuis]|uniref:Uncharacterized protein n=1 Tax=Parelaphostrongylus tenuis TaxID=148309 RepID=A0AAD5WD09_PARTN|nr:hypothetical protein KIN20_026392 [Parelaphostrongylus tenuis]